MAPPFFRQICVLLLASITLATGRLEETDYDFRPNNEPVFISKPGTHQVKQGDSVELHCKVRNRGPYPVVWRKGTRVIAAGDVLAAAKSRFQLVGSHTLKIDRVKLRDGGTFICAVSTDPVMELRHHLDVLYGPNVETVPKSGVVVAQKGTDETLQCIGDGKPQPTITWRKQSGSLPGGEERHAGDRYTLTDISRQMAGVYECTADNGLGQVAVGAINLQVQYPPEVEVERSTVYTGEGHTVTLVCLVYAEPPAKVVWSREGVTLDRGESDDVAMETRHALVIRSVGREDFGRYSCRATNGLGTMTRHMAVTGVADRVEVTSGPVSMAPDVYDLSWQVKSYSPIHEYKVAYRRSKHNMSVEEPSVWKEVIVPTKGSEPVKNVLYHQRIKLGRLQPATAYDLKIQARNAHGWNAVSDQFHFVTLTRGEALESRIAGTGSGMTRRLHPLLGAALVLVFVVLPVVF